MILSDRAIEILNNPRTPYDNKASVVLRCLKENDYQEWEKLKKDEYDTIFKTLEIQHEAMIDDNNEVLEPPYTELVYQVDAPSFYEWLNETKRVIVGTEITTDDNGIEYQKEIFEDELIRPYIAKEDFSTEIEEILIPYQKIELLKSLDITKISNGYEFYTNTESIGDIKGRNLNSYGNWEQQSKTLLFGNSRRKKRSYILTIKRSYQN